MLMLRPGWSSRLEFSPVVGLNQGLFKVEPDRTNGQSAAGLLSDAGGRPLALTGAAVTRSTTATGTTTAATTAGVSVDTFRAWLTANVEAIKASKPPASALRLEADSVPSGSSKDASIQRAAPEAHVALKDTTRRRWTRYCRTRRRVGFTGARSGSDIPVGGQIDYAPIGPKPNL